MRTTPRIKNLEKVLNGITFMMVRNQCPPASKPLEICDSDRFLILHHISTLREIEASLGTSGPLTSTKLKALFGNYSDEGHGIDYEGDYTTDDLLLLQVVNEFKDDIFSGRETQGLAI